MQKAVLAALLVFVPVFAGAQSPAVTSPNGNFASLLPDVAQNNSRLVTDAALEKAGCMSENDPAIVQHENCVSIAEMDLTKAFHTKKRTVLEITQAKFTESEFYDASSLSYCFIQRDKTRCQYGGDPNEFRGFSIVYPLAGTYPVLLAQLYQSGTTIMRPVDFRGPMGWKFISSFRRIASKKYCILSARQGKEGNTFRVPTVPSISICRKFCVV